MELANVPKRINGFYDDDNCVVMHHSPMESLVERVRDSLAEKAFNREFSDAEIMVAIRHAEVESGVFTKTQALEREFVEDVLNSLHEKAEGAKAGK